MPVHVTCPGVYIEELPAGTPTISGVATSITAFIGRAASGPADEPIAVFDCGDFQRQFGAMQADYPMSGTVQDFFSNGGGQALIVRLFQAPAVPTAATGIALLTLADSQGKTVLELKAASPGAWGNRLTARVDALNLRIDLHQPDGSVVTESFPNDLNVLDRILESQSALARVVILPESPPPDGSCGKGTGGIDSAPLAPANFQGGLKALDKADLFNILCIPPDQRNGDTDPLVYQTAAAYCLSRRAMLIVDPPTDWSTSFTQNPVPDPATLGISGDAARNAAVYFPRVRKQDSNQVDTFPACGIIAGIYARTDTTRGVWKAPAGQDASLNGIAGLELSLTDAENGSLNPLGINCLRAFPIIGPVVWGARTLRGADLLEDDYKYVPVRRLSLYIEESLYRGTQWAVFEPNDESLWSALRAGTEAFMADLQRQGAFYSYQATCDQTTTTAADIANGIVNIVVAFAPVKPAEFIVLTIQQQAAPPST